MSLKSHWFGNGQPSKLEELFVILSKYGLPYLYEFTKSSSNFDGWPFWNQWEFRDIMYLILKV